MLYAAVVDSPAFPEGTAELWDAATVGAIRGLQHWIEPGGQWVPPQTPWLCWDLFKPV